MKQWSLIKEWQSPTFDRIFCICSDVRVSRSMPVFFYRDHISTLLYKVSHQINFDLAIMWLCVTNDIQFSTLCVSRSFCGFEVGCCDPQQSTTTGEAFCTIRFAPVSIRVHSCELLRSVRFSHFKSHHFSPSIWLLLLAGDIEVNPGPVRYPCIQCSKHVKQSDEGIFCDRCKWWTHTVCCDVNPDEYNSLTAARESIDRLCPNCLSLLQLA